MAENSASGQFTPHGQFNLEDLWENVDHELTVKCGEARKASAAQVEIPADKVLSELRRQRSSSMHVSVRKEPAENGSGGKETKANRQSLMMPKDSSFESEERKRLRFRSRKSEDGKMTLPLKARVVRTPSSDAPPGMSEGTIVWILGTHTEQKVHVRDCIGRDLYEDPGYKQRRLEILPEHATQDDKLYPTLKQAIKHLTPLPTCLRAHHGGILLANETSIDEGDVLKILDDGRVTTDAAGEECLRVIPVINWPNKALISHPNALDLYVPLTVNVNVSPNIDEQGFELHELVDRQAAGKIDWPIRIRLFEHDGHPSRSSGHKFTILGTTVLKYFVLALDDKLVKVPVSALGMFTVVSSLTSNDLQHVDILRAVTLSMRYIDSSTLPSIGPGAHGFSHGSRRTKRVKRIPQSGRRTGETSTGVKPPLLPAKDIKEPVRSTPMPAPRPPAEGSAGSLSPAVRSRYGKNRPKHLSNSHAARRHSWQSDMSQAEDEDGAKAASDNDGDDESDGYSTIPDVQPGQASTQDSNSNSQGKVYVSATSIKDGQPVPQKSEQQSTLLTDVASSARLHNIYVDEFTRQPEESCSSPPQITRPVEPLAVESLLLPPTTQAKSPSIVIRSPQEVDNDTCMASGGESDYQTIEQWQSISESDSSDDIYSKLARDRRLKRSRDLKVKVERRQSADVLMWQFKCKQLEQELEDVKQDLAELRAEGPSTSLPNVTSCGGGCGGGPTLPRTCNALNPPATSTAEPAFSEEDESQSYLVLTAEAPSTTLSNRPALEIPRVEPMLRPALEIPRIEAVASPPPLPAYSSSDNDDFVDMNTLHPLKNRKRALSTVSTDTYVKMDGGGGAVRVLGMQCDELRAQLAEEKQKAEDEEKKVQDLEAKVQKLAQDNEALSRLCKALSGQLQSQGFSPSPTVKKFSYPSGSKTLGRPLSVTSSDQVRDDSDGGSAGGMFLMRSDSLGSSHGVEFPDGFTNPNFNRFNDEKRTAERQDVRDVTLS